jgi:transcriptional regulator with XRE-family HTH domain
MWLDFRELSFTMEGMATEPAIGTKIKRARERKRWTQKQLAEAVGVSQKTIDNWEHGHTKPRSAIGALEEVLDVSLDDEAVAKVPALSAETMESIRSELGAELGAGVIAFARDIANGQTGGAEGGHTRGSSDTSRLGSG